MAARQADANMAPASPPARAEPPVSLNADMSEHTTQAVPEQVTGTPTMVGVPVHGKGQDVHRAFSYQYSVASAWWQQWYQWYARNYTGAPFEPLGAVPPAAMQHGAAVAGARPPAQPPLRVATSASADGGAVDQERPRGPAAWQEGAAAGAPASTATGSAAGTVAGVPRPAVADKSKVCKNCGTDCTPFWRKDQADQLPLCNACGLYAKKNGSMRPPSLWKADKQQQGGTVFATAAAPAPAAHAAPAAVQPPAAMGRDRATSAVPVIMANGQQVMAQPWHGPRAMLPPGHAMLHPCYHAAPLPGPSAAELLQGSFSEAQMPPAPKAEPRRAAPPVAPPPRSASGPAAIHPPPKPSAPPGPSASSSLPPLPPLAHVPPPAGAGNGASHSHPPASPGCAATHTPHRSIVMQVSASLAKSRPSDSLGASAALLPIEDSAMAAEDDLDDDFARAAAAIGTDSEDDDPAAAAAATAATDALLAGPAVQELESSDSGAPRLQRSSTAPPGEAVALPDHPDASARCVSMGPSAEPALCLADAAMGQGRDSGAAACQV